MHRSISLRPPFTAAAAVVLAERDLAIVDDRYPRTYAAKVGLHALKVEFDVMIGAAVILEKVVQAFEGIPRDKPRADPILHYEVEITIVVVIAPCRELMSRSNGVVLKGDAFLSSDIGKGAIAVVVIKEIGVTHSDFAGTGPRDKEIEQSIVIVVAPDGGPGVGVVVYVGLVTLIDKGAIPLIPVEAVTLDAASGCLTPGDVEIE